MAEQNRSLAKTFEEYARQQRTSLFALTLPDSTAVDALAELVIRIAYDLRIKPDGMTPDEFLSAKTRASRERRLNDLEDDDPQLAAEVLKWLDMGDEK
jgi:hypothetical protein